MMKNDQSIDIAGGRPPRRRRFVTLIAITAALAFFATACSSDGSGASAGAEDDLTEEAVAMTLTQGEGEGPDALAFCFASSIDAIGRGNLDAGVEGFDECLTEDYVFEFQFAPGAPSVICPGDGCPVQDFSSIGEMRAVFANDFFVSAGYLATQHQLLNIEVDQNGDRADVIAYIQAQHFLPDNSVDIAWNDYAYTAVLEDGRWKMDSETIIGTAFLNFQGQGVGGDGSDASSGGPLSSATEVTLRNTLQDPGESEATYPSLFGQADDAFDEFAMMSASATEFPTALAQDGTPAGDLSGLYSIDLSEGAINFAVVAAADDPFWSNVFGLFPDGKVDRYYFTFDQPHGVSDYTSDNPNLNVRIDSDTVLVVELTAGYDVQPGVSFTVELLS